jgi:hypothetical protein
MPHTIRPPTNRYIGAKIKISAEVDDAENHIAPM